MAFNDSFKGLNWANTIQSLTCSVFGAGTIGSWLSLFLARAGIKFICLHDNDSVEERNLGGQLFSIDSIDKTKTESVKNIVGNLSLSETNIIMFNTFVNKESIEQHDEVSFEKYLFVGFDNIISRKIVFHQFLETDKCEIFIDGRMSIDEGEIFFIRKNDQDAINEYLSKYLPDDDTLADDICSLKSNSHSGAFVASLMATIFTNYLSNVEFGENIYSTPFKTNIDLKTLQVKQEYL